RPELRTLYLARSYRGSCRSRTISSSLSCSSDLSELLRLPRSETERGTHARGGSGVAEQCRDPEQLFGRSKQRVVRVGGAALRAGAGVGRDDDRRDVISASAVVLVPGDEENRVPGLIRRAGGDLRHPA